MKRMMVFLISFLLISGAGFALAGKYPKLHTLPPSVINLVQEHNLAYLGHFVDELGCIVVFTEKDGVCEALVFIPGDVSIYGASCSAGLDAYKAVCFIQKMCGVDVYGEK